MTEFNEDFFAVMLARMERLEMIMVKMHDREDCAKHIDAIAAEHEWTGARNRDGASLMRRIDEIKEDLDERRDTD